MSETTGGGKAGIMFGDAWQFAASTFDAIWAGLRSSASPRNAVGVGRRNQTPSLDCPRSSRSRRNFQRYRPWRWRISFASIGLALLITVALTLASTAQSVDGEFQLMTPFLVEPIPSELPNADEAVNSVLSDLLRSNRAPTILLTSESNRASLLIDPSRTGFGILFPLPVEAYQLHLAEGAGDTLWIGGVSRIAASINSARLSNGYLAKVDRGGHFFWQREYGERATERSIESLATLASGDVVVSGQDSDRTWLARISNDGNVVWEHYVGLGKRSAVTSIDGIIKLATIESIGHQDAYHENVAVWSFNEAGELLDHQTVREDINRIPGDFAAEVRIEKANNAIYVFSAWTARSNIKPLEVAKLNSSGPIVWRKELALTIGHLGGRASYSSPAITVLSNGDPLISCPVGEPTNLVLTRLDASNGNATQVEVRLSSPPPPHCAKRWAPVLFLKEKSPKSIWLFGSPWQGAGANACGWIGEASVASPQ